VVGVVGAGASKAQEGLGRETKEHPTKEHPDVELCAKAYNDGGRARHAAKLLSKACTILLSKATIKPLNRERKGCAKEGLQGGRGRQQAASRP